MNAMHHPPLNAQNERIPSYPFMPGPMDWYGRPGWPHRSGREQLPGLRMPRFPRRGRDRFHQNNQRHQNHGSKGGVNSDGTGRLKDISKLGNESSDTRKNSALVPVPVENSNKEVQNLIRTGTKKKKSISKSYPAKAWNREDADKALKVELETYKKQLKTLLVKFPDPEISWSIIRSFHNAIEKVHFQIPSGPRYCFVQLSEDSNVDEVINDLNKVDFYNLGKLKAERKYEKPESDIDLESIDPYTLYVGNLPITINPTLIKEKFPTAARIDVGFAQKMKNTRYAFIRYQTVEESIEAFKSSHGIRFDTRNIIVRFRRQEGKASLIEQISKKIDRKGRQNIIKRKRDMDNLQKMVKKKIKIEKGDTVTEKEPTLSDLLGNDENLDSDMESDEEKEVDDDEDDDDDDEECQNGGFNIMEEWKEQNPAAAEEEEEEDEEEEEEDGEDERENGKEIKGIKDKA